MIQTPNFRVVVVEDCEAVEVCGALKVRTFKGTVFIEMNFF